jgi:hypothetical protein
MYNLTSQHMQAHKQEYVHKQNTQYPYENVSFFFHRDITVAIKPASNAVQSKNIWNESDIRPRLEKKINAMGNLPFI